MFSFLQPSPQEIRRLYSLLSRATCPGHLSLLNFIAPIMSVLVVKICTRLKKFIRFEGGKPRWDLEKLYAERQKVQDTPERKLGAVEV
jgi:hypothetical protein